MRKDELISIISSAHKTNSIELILAGEGIEEIPAEIGQLQQLEHLNLGSTNSIIFDRQIWAHSTIPRTDWKRNSIKTLPP